MKILNFLKNKKIILFKIFLTFYVSINLIGGERGLISYFEKKNIAQVLEKQYKSYESNLKSLDIKNELLSNKVDLDYMDIILRENLKFGKKDEILIILK